ncbi:MAG: chemotaxis protein CheW [Candidatus Eremiobacteraeota bacterium]|nr:chemotaxis protein CheW [Candidatus Eremiobacteraeota bacterium]
MIPLLFGRSGGQRVAFYASEVEEVLLRPALTATNLSTPLVEGWFRLGHTWVPVLALAGLLGLEVPEPSLNDPLLLLASQPQTCLRLERIESVQEVSWEALLPTENVQGEGGAQAATVSHGDEPALLLSTPRLLLEKERLLLARSREHLEQREHVAEQLLSQDEPA